ncbi:MAG: glycosyltransferase family 2 protein [Sulfolobales archaeon]
MRITNAFLIILPGLVAFILTLLVGVGILGSFITFFIILDMVVSTLMVALFITYWRKDNPYEKLILDRIKQPSPSIRKYRVAIVVPVFNEPPKIVAETAIACKMVLGDLGDVYVLDDSTDDNIKRELDWFSRMYGFYILRRGERRGYKAGAVNNWLAKYGEKYDLLTIMDADQRLIPGVFEHVLQLFEDPEVAFVQVPQYYSELNNTVSLSAYIQLIPFLRVVMRGRQLKGSAFSLGSGTIYRIQHLKVVGGLYEETVTEDIFTSVMLHEKGYKSVYIDLPFVWHGVPPKDLPSYMSQQNRWSLGNYQLIKKFLRSEMRPSILLDYLNGLYYWLHVGLLTIFDVIAPTLFLLFGIYFMNVNPVNYLITYIPIFLASLILFLKIMRKYGYGFIEFAYHQGIQMVASLSVTLALFEWILGRSKLFKVTPKGDVGVKLTIYHLYYILVVAILAISLVVGIKKTLDSEGVLIYAYIINLFWTGWWLIISASALYISLSLPVSRKRINKVIQSYEGLDRHILVLLKCATSLESAIATHYSQLSKRFKEYQESFNMIAKESSEHAEIYSRLLNQVKSNLRVYPDECRWTGIYLDKALRRIENRGLKELILIQEERTMYVYAQLLRETCKLIIGNTKDLDKIAEDEIRHEITLRQIIEQVNSTA